MYNRYKEFTSEDGKCMIVPFIPIEEKSTDRFAYWKSGISRMDLLSWRYYGDASYGWLIMQANPHLPSVEFLIDDGERIRIPFPLDSTIVQYGNSVKIYRAIEGNDKVQ